jgi:O-antigen/teichoic acid export membrane protein
LSGRDRFTRNVLASWAGYGVFVIAGFVLPRFIDQRIGQTALGVWDFAWSLISYFSLAQVGIGSSVNAYIARYRAEGDIDGLRRAASSVTCLQLVAALLVLLLTVAATWAVPSLMRDRLGEHVSDARWVVALLGSALAVQMAFDAFNGIITGCHRWDLHNYLNAGAYGVTVVAMIAALLLGGGLRSLALANFCGMTATEFARAWLAHRVCAGLRVRWAYASWRQARQMLAFGGKSFVHTISRLLLYQTNNIVVASCFGPAGLAVYARPSSLVRHAQTFINKFAFILTPTASSLRAGGEHEALARLALQAGRFSAYVAVPMVLTLAILGDPILRLWMGTRYEQGLVLAILAVGHLTAMTQQSLLNILTGINAHGRPGLVNLIAAVCGFGMVLLLVGPLHAGLAGAALAVAVPLTLANGVYVPIYTCRQLRMPLSRYIRHAWLEPLACVAPFGLCLAAARFCGAQRPWQALMWLAGGALVLGVIYWQCVLPASMKSRITGRLLPAGTKRVTAPAVQPGEVH